MYDICCVGHITSDKVVNSHTTLYMPGGTALYFSSAFSQLNAKYLLVTALAEADFGYVRDLQQKNITVKAYPSPETVYFENIYGENQDDRTQNVLHKAAPFHSDQFNNIDANFFHLGPLLADDIPSELVQTLAAKARVSLDVQGFLREVKDKKVYATQWPQMAEVLPFIEILKADVAELQALTGCEDTIEGVKVVADLGVKEIIITNGSQGSVIYAGNESYTIPAYPPDEIIDATGCGDTYMAGYLFQRFKAAGVEEAGNFAAAMAGLKTAKTGPFTGNESDVLAFLSTFVEL